MLHIRQVKTGTELAIPIHPVLEAIIANTPNEHLTFLTTAFGKPFTAAGFGNWFREMCDAAKLSHCSAHGLRKAAARRLAEAGCSEHEIGAITGHATLREIVRYTKAADQRRLASCGDGKGESENIKWLTEQIVSQIGEKHVTNQTSKEGLAPRAGLLTSDPAVNSRLLYQLSYRGTCALVASGHCTLDSKRAGVFPGLCAPRSIKPLG